ncbi:MAG: aldose 1-epimerase family protein [Lachnospiraceae bacterium]|nr:aldose 1-epimerase family protein [Lachnospiraceae bacterium]
MNKYIIKNEELIVTVNSFGAELSSIKDAKTDWEYLWCGDAKYWNRQSPILFPIVGILKDKEMRLNGKVYSMGQHGFARDNEFELESQTNDEIWFVFSSNDETIKMYPFKYMLHIGYKLSGRKLEVLWEVENKNNITMPFSIGGHPAFYYPNDMVKNSMNNSDMDSEDLKNNNYEYYVQFDCNKDLIYGEIDMNSGCIVKGIEHHLKLDKDGIFKIDEHTFDNDALVFEHSDVNKVSMLHANKSPYITMEFEMPLFALWSPTKKNAPFMCIEPWCGRCDSTDFNGEFDEKEYINKIETNEVFNQKYSIVFH